MTYWSSWRLISSGLGRRRSRTSGASSRLQLLVEDALAREDARVADVNAGTGDELLHFRVALAAEGTHREIGGAGHWEEWFQEGAAGARVDDGRSEVLVVFEHLVHDAVGLRFLGGHAVIAVGVLLDLLLGSAAVMGDDVVEALLQLVHVVHAALDIAGGARAPPETWWIMMSAFGQGVPLALGAGAEQHRPHARGHADDSTCSCRR